MCYAIINPGNTIHIKAVSKPDLRLDTAPQTAPSPSSRAPFSFWRALPVLEVIQLGLVLYTRKGVPTTGQVRRNVNLPIRSAAGPENETWRRDVAIGTMQKPRRGRGLTIHTIACRGCAGSWDSAQMRGSFVLSAVIAPLHSHCTPYIWVWNNVMDYHTRRAHASMVLAGLSNSHSAFVKPSGPLQCHAQPLA